MSKPTTKPRRTRASPKPEAAPIFEEMEKAFFIALYERAKLRALLRDESAAPTFRTLAARELPSIEERIQHARTMYQMFEPRTEEGEPQ